LSADWKRLNVDDIKGELIRMLIEVLETWMPELSVVNISGR